VIERYATHVLAERHHCVPLGDLLADVTALARREGEVEVRGEAIVVTVDGEPDEWLAVTFEADVPRYAIACERTPDLIELAWEIAALIVMRVRGQQVDPDLGVVTTSEREPSELGPLDWVEGLEQRAADFIAAGEPDADRDALLDKLDDYNVIAYGPGNQATLVEENAPTLARFHAAAHRMFAYLDSPERAALFPGAPPERLPSELSLDLVRQPIAHGLLALLEHHQAKHALDPGEHAIDLGGERHRVTVRRERTMPAIIEVMQV